jgi:hypothetical protein
MKSAPSTTSPRLSSRTPAPVLASLLLLSAVPVLARAQNSDTSQAVTDHIHGVVINSIDKKPIARALVTSQDQRMATMTDSQGRFTFDILRQPPRSASNATMNGPVGFSPQVLSGMVFGGPGQSMTVNLMVRRPGYLNANLPVRLATDPQTTSEDIELKLIPESVIRGHLSISDPAEPIGVIVQLRRRQVQQGVAVWTQAGGIQANSRGDYTFAELQPGDYKVMSQAWIQRTGNGTSAPDESIGYTPAFDADGADLASTPPIHLGAGQTVEANLNPRATTFYHVTIPIPNMPKGIGINVALGDQDQLPGLSVNYNSQSQMAEGFLPNGAYDIHISSYGQPPASGLGRLEVAGKPVKAPPITLVPAGQISVVVRQEYTATQPTTDSNPPQTNYLNTEIAFQAPSRRSLEISLQSLHPGSPGANLKNTPNKGDDDLVLDNVQQGTYHVVARAYRGYVASITSNGTDLIRQPLVVGSGGTSAPIEVTIRDDSATLTGSVSFPDPNTQLTPDSFFTITCIPLDAGSGAPLPQGGAYRGKFTVQNLPPGRYLVLAFTNSMTKNNPMMSIEYQNEDVMRNYQSKGTVVTLSPGQKADIQVPLIPEEEN